MIDLATAFAGLVRHQVATPAAAPPEAGIAWVWGRDGIYKRGRDAVREVTVLVSPTRPTPGLASVLPGSTWHDHPRRLPGQLLAAMLAHARKAAHTTAGGVLRPIEVQYHVTLESGQLRVRVPEQQGTGGRVSYETPDAPILLDLHSHHGMPAFFSGTDDRDDTGLGVSAVVGHIFHERPQIAVRLCCYGHHQQIAALAIFDHLAGCQDTYGGAHADDSDH